MNKKGDLINNVGETLVAVIGLVIIFVGVGWAIWSVYANQEDSNAQKLVDSIAGKIDALADGQNNSFVFAGFSGGSNWFLGVFNKNEIRPDKCYLKNCICICKGVPQLDLHLVTEWPSGVTLEGEKIVDIEQQKIANFCQEKGFCRFLDKNIRINTDMFTYDPDGQEMLYKALILQENISEALLVPDKLFELEIDKTKDSITLFPA